MTDTTIADTTQEVTDATQEAVKQVNQLTQYVQDSIPGLITFGLKVLAALVAFFIGRLVIRWIRKIVRRSFERSGADKGVEQFVDSLLKYGLYALLVFSLISSLGFDTTSVAAVLASGGVAIGLALQGSLSNFAGGVLILLLKPFVVGDYIIEDTNGKEGTVKEIDDGYEVTVDTVFEKRACAFSITITEDMTSITGMSFAPVYSLGENMEKAALNTLMGMGTVFIVLIFISLLISCFKCISAFENKKKAAAPAAPAPAPAAPAPVALTTAAPAGTDDAEMERLAVMTAIIEHRRRTASSDSLVVRPIKRSAGNRWKRS